MSVVCQAEHLTQSGTEGAREEYVVGAFGRHDMVDIRSAHDFADTHGILAGMEKPSAAVESPALAKAKAERGVSEALGKQIEVAKVIEIGEFSRDIILFHVAKINRGGIRMKSELND